MNFLRKSTLHFLSLVLLASLVGTALATSSRFSVSHPDKIKAWLSESNVYDSFISNGLIAASKDTTTAQIPYTDPAIRAAAEAAITKEFVEQQINVVVDSNYAWLKGKTATPSFSLNFTAPKQQFADNVAQAAQTHYNSLPICTASQLSALQNTGTTINPLTATCRPTGFNVASSLANLKQAVVQNESILPNNTLTQDNLNSQTMLTTTSTPYYQHLHWLPPLYRASLQLPWILALASVVLIFSILTLAKRRRSGVQRLAIVFTLSGLLLVAFKFGMDVLLTNLTASTAGSDGAVHYALTVFLQKVEIYATTIDLLFGCAFILIGITALAVLYATHPSKPHTPKTPTPSTANDIPPAKPRESDTNLVSLPTATDAPAPHPPISVTAPLPPRSVPTAAPTTAPELPHTKKPHPTAKPLRRRRLVQ